ncbi:VWA domain-containing protein [Pseudarthrobacter sp. AL07]|uniref:vWA domain-containing protein n=1 Tax=unclassified Pseudarthrobacter TaxID=2647000 RepID=UPI00249C5B7D|nr:MULTISPECIES: VWA domain-containing protein [unclassified Pseudarthrobacter]MDI3195088.1 VWA domain-containing protein [Pseudarthrobacter sp. AL20]MDI3209154.1 VWA domain-containing protein [Pseudarthrobacter sp. AL07]
MTLQPILPWWVMAPLIAATVLFLVWRLVQASRAHSSGVRRDWLFRGALVLLLLSAALRPGVPGGSSQAATADVSVFFVVDTSSSIAAEDYGDHSPRLEGVRQDIMAIASELAGARFSLLTFDSNAVVRMPLTTDTTTLDTIVSVLEPQVTAFSKGSSITAAGTLLAERLRAARDSHPERPRVVYYLGDGEQTSAKAAEPLRVGGGLVDGGAVLGYGTAGGGRMKENTGQGPGQDVAAGYIQDRSSGMGRDALSVIEEARLQGIAGQLGVPYVHRSAGDPVAPMMQAADPGDLERSAADSDVASRTELYWLLAACAFLLALRESFLLLRQWRQLRPEQGVRT